jgi:transposase
VVIRWQRRAFGQWPALSETQHEPFPSSTEDWLPENYSARFIVEVVDGLDLGALEKGYAGRGSSAYHPSMLLAQLIYGYATGVFFSRKAERAT